MRLSFNFVLVGGGEVAVELIVVGLVVVVAALLPNMSGCCGDYGAAAVHFSKNK